MYKVVTEREISDAQINLEILYEGEGNKKNSENTIYWNKVVGKCYELGNGKVIKLWQNPINAQLIKDFQFQPGCCYFDRKGEYLYTV